MQETHSGGLLLPGGGWVKGWVRLPGEGRCKKEKGDPGQRPGELTDNERLGRGTTANRRQKEEESQ